MDQDNYEVIIIGAGLAGLSSARTLTRSGINDFFILEAKDRVGGRIFTKGYGNFNFDFGAQWIHGQKGNKLYDFAVQHDLISSQQSEGEGNQIEMLNCLNTKISGLQECIWSKEGKRSIRHWLKT